MKRLVFLFILFVAFSCGSTKKISNQNLSYLYAPGINFIYPDYKAYNFQKDTSRIFYSLPAEDLLFMNQNDSMGFMASYGFTYVIYSNYESKQILDSGQINFELMKPTVSSGAATGYFDVHTRDSSNYLALITLTDFNRNQAVTSFLTIDRTGSQSPDNFIALDKTSNLPLTSSTGKPGTRLRLIGGKQSDRSIYIRYFKNKYGLSAPPFGNELARPLSYIADKTILANAGDMDNIILDEPGIYHFQYDTMMKEGYTIMCFDEDYPKITTAEDLLESIRYLTTRQEYDKIRNSKDTKQAVDDFWIQMAGNKERARVLIRNYYSRVQLANRFFTSYLEGWKSDRGLIFIIFGPPGTIYRTNDSENWNYTQNYYYGTLNFTFDKLNNPFTDNDYKLRRSNYYEMPWYRAVDSWRDGRVVNDME